MPLQHRGKGTAVVFRGWHFSDAVFLSGWEYNKEEKSNYINGIGKYEVGLISLLDLNTVTLEKENA